MQLRCCSNLHFITTVQGAKVRNVDSKGKPGLVVKKLQDIYEAEDAKMVGSYSTSTSQNRYVDTAFMPKKVKMERLCIPVVHRELREVDCANHNDHDDDESMSDSDDSMSLKQLTERWKTKKRKLSSDSVPSPKPGCDKILPEEEDDFEMKETLGSWKLKLSKKKSKGEGKSANKNVHKSGCALSVESEPLACSEDSMEVNRNPMPVVCVKLEVPEPEFFESPSLVASIDDPVSEDVSDGGLKTDECDNRQLVVFAGDYSIRRFDGLYFDTHVEDSEVNRCDNCTLFADECQNCALNEVCYDHLEFLEPLAVLLPSDEEIAPFTNHEESCQPSLISTISDSTTQESCDNYGKRSPEVYLLKDQSLQMCSSGSTSDVPGISAQTNCSSESTPHFPSISAQTNCSSESTSHIPSISSQTGCISGEPAIDREVDTEDASTEHLPSTCEVGSLSCPIQSSDSSMCSQSSFSSNDDFVPEEDKRQPFVGKSTNSERLPTASSQTNADANASLNSQPLQPPERLPSKRKAISPTSQEQLCLAMNSAELCDDTDHERCKEKQSLGKQTEGKASTVSLSFVPASRDVSSVQSVKLNRTKAMINSNQILKKSKNEKRGSPPKGNLEGPRFTRTLPHVSTGCTSIRGCSESAITFSQRQMHDIESLAVRLLSELKSMKDIVEQKLLFESYRSISLKSDADEVKMAIYNATRVEETARKWLSTMARDCNRFCKIMKLTQDDSVATKDELRRGRKKIQFADEAGGMLCHVKFFDNCITPSEPPSNIQTDQP